MYTIKSDTATIAMAILDVGDVSIVADRLLS